MSTPHAEEIRDFVLTTLSEQMNVPIDDRWRSEDVPIGTGGVDLESLSLVELLLRLERQFGVSIPDSDIESIGAMTLGELAKDVVRRKEAA